MTLTRSAVVKTSITAVVLLAMVVGTLVFMNARKQVTLDVEGEVTTVTTFASSVEELLGDQGVELGKQDVVEPAPDTALRDGTVVTVRYGKQLDVLVDGEPDTVWTTAIDAEEALAVIDTRADTVELVAHRTFGNSRADLPIVLSADNAVVITHDGKETHVPAGSVTLAEVLTHTEIVIGEYDRVRVVSGDSKDAPVNVVIQRVKIVEETETKAIDFESLIEKDGSKYTDYRKVTTEGKKGERTIVDKVVLVDGEEESRELISDEVTAEPVNEVTTVGTKARPAPIGTPTGGQGKHLFGDPVWDALAKCESGNRPGAVSSSGAYHGMFQFSPATWRGVGGTGLPSQASPEEQLKRAKALQARSGWGQWPHCSSKMRAQGLIN